MGCRHGIEGACTRCAEADTLVRKDAEIARLQAALLNALKQGAVLVPLTAADHPGHPGGPQARWSALEIDAIQAYAARCVAASREQICAAIKAEDDHASLGDYMLDSEDCIAVVRGTWVRAEHVDAATDRVSPRSPAASKS